MVGESNRNIEYKVYKILVDINKVKNVIFRFKEERDFFRLGFLV